VARETLDYLLREMRAPDGTFYSATDADSPSPSGQREEGRFFTWTPKELAVVLGPGDAKIAQAWLGVTEAGNLGGRSVLSAHESPAPPERLASIRSRLLEARNHRPPPLRDNKVIVAWNGLALSALSRAALVLGDERYRAAAVAAATTLTAPLRAGAPLPHQFVDGKPQGAAFADDIVFLAGALLDLFELTADVVWLDEAIKLTADLELRFADRVSGGYFLAAGDARLPMRTKPDYDGPLPSPSSEAALVWLRLYALTGEESFRASAETTVRALSRRLTEDPLALADMLLALDFATDEAKEVVIALPTGRGALAPAARPLLDVLGHTFVPSTIVIVGSASDLSGPIGARVPGARDKFPQAGRATAYVCKRGACKLPTSDPATFTAQLAEIAPYR
jgi:uncharacterized protein YyaL (SSP411 family)